MFRGYFRYFAAVSLNGIFMKENKLSQLLNSLSREEWKEFEKYLASPFFNSGRNYIPLLKLLKTKPGTFSGKIEEHEKLYTKLYPGKPFNKNVINTMLSGFTKMLEGYLIQKDYDSLSKNKKLALLRQLNYRNCDDLFAKESAAAIKNAGETPFDLDIIEFLHELQVLIVRSKYKTHFDKSIEPEVYKRSDYRFFVNYLWMLNEDRDQKVMRFVLNKKSDDRISSSVLKRINSGEVLAYVEKNYPWLTDTVGLIILCLTSRDIVRVKELYYKNYNLLQPYLALNVAYYVEGLIVDLITEGKRELVKDRHFLHRFILEKNLLVNNITKIMNTRVTENFLNTAFWCKEYSWINSFILKYSQTFADDMRESFLNYAKSCIFYGEGKYPEALKKLKLVGDAPYTMRLKMKEMEMQIFYEMKEPEHLYYSIDNYVKFKSFQFISEINRKIMESNISAFKELVNYSFGNKKSDPDFAAAKLMNAVPSQFGDWILEKISDMHG